MTLVAVSKTKPNSAIIEAYDEGYRVFGENKVQEMVEKASALPKDIKWHMIGHLQKNKVKYIIPFIHLIHSVDSIQLLEKINSISEKNQKVTNCLIQIKIAKEESKYGILKSNFNIINENMNQFSFVKITTRALISN